METSTAEETREEKVRRFQLGIRELHDATQNYFLGRVLKFSGPVLVADVVGALGSLTQPTFTEAEVNQLLEVIESDDPKVADAPSSITNRVKDSKAARELLELYADILEVPRRTYGDGKVHIVWIEAPEIDNITG